jgi:predicted GNAT family acetyltransferase
VKHFGPEERYCELGRGIAVLKNGRIVSACSSYSRYREGIETEVDTLEEERRKGLASAASAALILLCLDEGLYPCWDAANGVSVRLAEKLGYTFGGEYSSYWIE